MAIDSFLLVGQPLPLRRRAGASPSAGRDSHWSSDELAEVDREHVPQPGADRLDVRLAPVISERVEEAQCSRTASVSASLRSQYKRPPHSSPLRRRMVLPTRSRATSYLRQLADRDVPHQVAGPAVVVWSRGSSLVGLRATTSWMSSGGRVATRDSYAHNLRLARLAGLTQALRLVAHPRTLTGGPCSRAPRMKASMTSP